MTRPIIVIQGAEDIESVPGLTQIADIATLRCATDIIQMKDAIKDADIVFSWDFSKTRIRDVWNDAKQLKWIHWGGAGVNVALFEELIESDVILTNSRGIFDQPMAEYVLGLILIFTKRFDQMLSAQQAHEWRYQMSESVAGQKALIIGVGSIGRAIGRLLKSTGMEVKGVGQSARNDDPDFGTIAAVSELNVALSSADFVINVTPLTDKTFHLIGKSQFSAMKNSARFINVGRGPIVDESALIDALVNAQIAGAALDVFETEPLPADNPLWDMPNVLVSPHISGDVFEYPKNLAALFVENFHRYLANRPLKNMIDKKRGY